MADMTKLHSLPSGRFAGQLSSRGERLPSPDTFLPADPVRLEIRHSLNNFLDPRSKYNNGYDTQADYFTRDARNRYIAADQRYFATTGQNMQIHSGTRTVLRQAELFVAYKWHNQGNRANWPGCSFHNWGVAADMIRTDEDSVVDAMRTAGWTRTIVDEGWHFECTGSYDHASAARAIADFRIQRTGLAYRWADHVGHRYLKYDQLIKRAAVHEERRVANQQVGMQLDAEVTKYNQALAAFQARADEHQKSVDHYNAELERAHRLSEEIAELPSGPVQDEKVAELEALVEWLDVELARLNGALQQIEAEAARLDNALAALEHSLADYKEESDWLAQEHAALAELNRQVIQHENDSNDLLAQIDQIVSSSRLAGRR